MQKDNHLQKIIQNLKDDYIIIKNNTKLTGSLQRAEGQWSGGDEADVSGNMEHLMQKEMGGDDQVLICMCKRSMCKGRSRYGN
jgi:hypothetical protein